MLETWPCCLPLVSLLTSPVAGSMAVSPWPHPVLECCWEPAHPVTPNPSVSFGCVGAAREQVAERPMDENARRKGWGSLEALGLWPPTTVPS